VSVKNFSGALLYNVPVGGTSLIYLKAGGGSTKYGSDCPVVATTVICGSSGALLGGAGVRVGLTPTLLLRGEALVSRNKSDRPAPLGAITLTNFGLNLGLSFMPGSKPIPIRTATGCWITGIVARHPRRRPGGRPRLQRRQRQRRVADSLDRCPSTPPGASVDARGCTTDSDGDNIPDGIDRCPIPRPACWWTRTGAPATATATPSPTAWTAAPTPPGAPR
jgi:hypothetical protein